MRDGFDPVNTFEKLMAGWWKIVIVAILGGLVGLVFSFVKPPAYQAEAIFHASIDFTEINFENLVVENGAPARFTQFDEDLALQVVQRILLSEMNAAYQYALTLDPDLDLETFERDKQIMRYHAQWRLRYRHKDPKTAQAIVNFWADEGLQALQKAQETDRAETFVIVDLVSRAGLPQSPLYANRNTLVTAGTVFGLVIGILLVDFRGRYFDRVKAEA